MRIADLAAMRIFYDYGNGYFITVSGNMYFRKEGCTVTVQPCNGVCHNDALMQQRIKALALLKMLKLSKTRDWKEKQLGKKSGTIFAEI